MLFPIDTKTFFLTKCLYLIHERTLLKDTVGTCFAYRFGLQFLVIFQFNILAC